MLPGKSLSTFTRGRLHAEGGGFTLPGRLAAGGRTGPDACPPQVTVIPHQLAGATIQSLQLGTLAFPWFSGAGRLMGCGGTC